MCDLMAPVDHKAKFAPESLIVSIKKRREIICES